MNNKQFYQYHTWVNYLPLLIIYLLVFYMIFVYWFDFYLYHHCFYYCIDFIYYICHYFYNGHDIYTVSVIVIATIYFAMIYYNTRSVAICRSESTLQALRLLRSTLPLSEDIMASTGISSWQPNSSEEATFLTLVRENRQPSLELLAGLVSASKTEEVMESAPFNLVIYGTSDDQMTKLLAHHGCEIGLSILHTHLGLDFDAKASFSKEFYRGLLNAGVERTWIVEFLRLRHSLYPWRLG